MTNPKPEVTERHREMARQFVGGPHELSGLIEPIATLLATVEQDRETIQHERTKAAIFRRVTAEKASGTPSGDKSWDEGVQDGITRAKNRISEAIINLTLADTRADAEGA